MPQDKEKHTAEHHHTQQNERCKYQIFSEIAFPYAQKVSYVEGVIGQCEEEIEERNHSKIEDIGAHSVKIT